MVAKIYRPAKSAMTSGQANSRRWVLDYTPAQPRRIDPLMGWTGSLDTQSQVRLRFDSREEAVSYAQKHGLAYQLAEPKPRSANIRPRGYGSNFSTDRRLPWTH